MSFANVSEMALANPFACLRLGTGPGWNTELDIPVEIEEYLPLGYAIREGSMSLDPKWEAAKRCANGGWSAFWGFGCRPVRRKAKGSDDLLGITLRDCRKYPVAVLSCLYHERWGVEEIFKTLKQSLAIDRFHAYGERGVKQELLAHFVLMTLTRLFANHGEVRLRCDVRRWQLNFRAAGPCVHFFRACLPCESFRKPTLQDGLR